MNAMHLTMGKARKLINRELGNSGTTLEPKSPERLEGDKHAD